MALISALWDREKRESSQDIPTLSLFSPLVASPAGSAAKINISYLLSLFPCSQSQGELGAHPILGEAAPRIREEHGRRLLPAPAQLPTAGIYKELQKCQQLAQRVEPQLLTLLIFNWKGTRGSLWLQQQSPRSSQRHRRQQISQSPA